MIENKAHINWFPGHMNKARRLIEDNIKNVDLVIEIRDARIPLASHNPMLDKLINNKRRLVILNKCDLADITTTKLWIEKLKNIDVDVVAIDCLNDDIRKMLPKFIKESCDEILMRAKRRGILKKVLKVMVVGIPNVGKSTLINRIVKKNVAKTENRPGVTKNVNWIRIHPEIDLMDTPGILWPSFETSEIGNNLALVGSISSNAFDHEKLSRYAIEYLRINYNDKLKERYNLETLSEDIDEIIIGIAESKKLYIKDGAIDYQRVYELILNDFKNNKFKGVTLEFPE